MQKKLSELIKKCYILSNDVEEDLEVEPSEIKAKEWLLGGADSGAEYDDGGNFFYIPDQKQQEKEEFDNLDSSLIIKPSTLLNSELLASSLLMVEKEQLFALHRKICKKRGTSVIISYKRCWDIFIFEVKPKYTEAVIQLVNKIPKLLINDSLIEKKPSIFNFWGGEYLCYQEDGKLFLITGHSD